MIITKVKEYSKSLMINNKEKWFLYHNWDHVIDVLERVKYLCVKENINDDLTELLLIAAYFHDVWYTVDPSKHEEISANIASSFLLENNYPQDRIDIIKSLILCTIITQKPSNQLEEIISDADLDNFWRDDFFEKWDDLKKEIENLSWKEIFYKDWYNNTYNLIQNSIIFYTDTQKKERNPKFEKNKVELLDKINSIS